MKKIALMLVGIALSAHAFAGFSIDDIDDYQERVEVDAPNLVKLPADWTLGAEVAKDINQTNSNEGWEVTGKATWNGTFADLSGLGKA